MPDRLDGCAGSTRFGEDGICEPRPGLLGPVAKGCVAEDGAGEPRVRSHPEEAAALSEVAEGTRRVALAGPVRPLSVAQLEAEPPVVGIHPAEAGEDADETREGNGRRLSQALRGDRTRSQQLAANREQAVERPTPPGGRRPVERSGQSQPI